MKNYGKALILDLHECDTNKFNRKDLREFCKHLCKLLNMKRIKLVFWDYKGYPEEYKLAPVHLKGTSAIQFISTSNITIHTLDVMKRVYLNIFTCKDFEPKVAEMFCRNFFNCKKVKQSVVIERI